MPKRNLGLWLVLILVFPIVFSIIFFMTIKENTTNTWISYGAILLSYLISIGLIANTYSSDKDPAIRRTIPAISGVFFLVVFFYSILYITKEEQVTKDQIINELIIFGAAILVLAIALIIDSHTMNQLKQHKEDMFFIHEGSVLLKTAMDLNSDEALGKKISHVHDLIHSSPSQTDPAVKENENKILLQANMLIQSLNDNDLEAANKSLDTITSNLSLRNNRLKYSR